MAVILLRNVNPRGTVHKTHMYISALSAGAKVGDVRSFSKYDAQELRDGTLRSSLQVAYEVGHFDVARLLLWYSKVRPEDIACQAPLFVALEVAMPLWWKCSSRRGHRSRALALMPATIAARSGSLGLLDLVIGKKCKI